jgi:tRNA(Arg) A34 adenosine deaminase TadA
MLSEALELARKNEVVGLPQMGAIIYKDKKILATGINSKKTHPLMQRFTDNHLKVCLHAEMDAIKNVLRKNSPKILKGASIFVARVMKNGQRGIAKPCTVCQKALEHYGIEAVYWTEYE